MATWTVDEWGSHPDEENDDCWTGENFENEDDARAKFELEPEDTSTLFLELKGPCCYREVRRTKHKARRRDDDGWEREHAMQAGMGLGFDGYNDAMGWGYEPQEDE